MSRNLPPLNALRAFDAAGRHQSFSRAAQELSVSHSAISRHVRGLEARLGVQLFRDLPRGLELTPIGRTYLDQILPALDAIAEATDDLAAVPTGRVTVNSEPLFAQKFIIPRLAIFQKANPEVEVRLDSSNLLADVERYEADIAIRHVASGKLDMPSELLAAGRLYPFASPELMRTHIREPSDLLNLPRFRDRTKSLWPHWFDEAGVEVESLTEPDWRMLPALSYEAALNGLGVYLGTSECVSHDLALGRFVQCFDICIHAGSYHLLAGSRGARRKAVRQFRSWLLDETSAFRSVPADS